MKNAKEFALFFMKKGMDTNPNTFDGNMKLQKMLFFANLIHLAEFESCLFNDEILAFRNGCVIEEIRLAYKNNYAKLKEESDRFIETFTEQERESLELTMEIFGNLSANELSNLNHQFKFWNDSYQNGISTSGFHDKTDSCVSVFSMKKEINIIIELIKTYRESKISEENYELVNGVKFYYDFNKKLLTDEIYTQLEDYSLYADDKSYSIYFDEKDLVIY